MRSLAPSELESISPVMLRLSSEGDPLDSPLLGRLCAFCGGVGAIRLGSASPHCPVPASSGSLTGLLLLLQGCSASLTGLLALLQPCGWSVGAGLLMLADQRSMGTVLTAVCTASLLLLAWVLGAARASTHSAL